MRRIIAIGRDGRVRGAVAAAAFALLAALACPVSANSVAAPEAVVAGKVEAVAALSPLAPASGPAQGALPDGALVVIVGADSRIDEIELGELRKLFLGKSRRLPDGSLAKLASLSDLDDEFNRRALGKSSAQVRKIWAGLRFSGRSKPPKEFDDAEAVIRFVQESRGAIGFVPAESVDARVKPILHFPDN